MAETAAGEPSLKRARMEAPPTNKKPTPDRLVYGVRVPSDLYFRALKVAQDAEGSASDVDVSEEDPCDGACAGAGAGGGNAAVAGAGTDTDSIIPAPYTKLEKAVHEALERVVANNEAVDYVTDDEKRVKGAGAGAQERDGNYMRRPLVVMLLRDKSNSFHVMAMYNLLVAMVSRITDDMRDDAPGGELEVAVAAVCGALASVSVGAALRLCGDSTETTIDGHCAPRLPPKFKNQTADDLFNQLFLEHEDEDDNGNDDDVWPGVHAFGVVLRACFDDLEDSNALDKRWPDRRQPTAGVPLTLTIAYD